MALGRLPQEKRCNRGVRRGGRDCTDVESLECRERAVLRASAGDDGAGHAHFEDPSPRPLGIDANADAIGRLKLLIDRRGDPGRPRLERASRPASLNLNQRENWSVKNGCRGEMGKRIRGGGRRATEPRDELCLAAGDRQARSSQLLLQLYDGAFG